MTFARGKWRCKGDGCQDDADISVMVVISTPGKQRERVKLGSKTVRFCMACARDLADGRVPKTLSAEIRTTVQKVTGARWDGPKLVPHSK